MKFFSENPFSKGKEALESEQSATRLEQKLEKLFTPKSFADRWKHSNIAAILLSYLCNLFSSITAFSIVSFVIYKAIKGPLGGFVGILLSLLLSGLVVAIIEVIKRHSTNHFLQDVLQFGRFSVSLFVLVLFMCGASVLTSFYGAKKLPQTTQSLPALADTSQIARTFNSQIANSETKKEVYFENNKKSNGLGGFRLSSKLMPTYNEMIKEISNLKNDKKSALSQALNKHENELKNYKTETQNLGEVLGYVALGVELIFFLSMLGSWLYFWNCYKEKFSLNLPEQTQNTTQELNQNEAKQQPTNNAQRPIGFLQTIAQLNEKRLSCTPHVCLHCGEKYVHNHKKQKFCCSRCKNAYHNLKRLSCKAESI